MSGRRAGRELALQALYELEMGGEGTSTDTVASLGPHFVSEGTSRGPESEAFARELVHGVQGDRVRIDGLITDALAHWQLDRLSRVDLCILRLATFELVAKPEIPVAVTIDEAIEVARRFGSEDSASFVNGVLDHIAGAAGAKQREVRPS
jgi:N utilization substance protein B